jgi:hypothetical protein
MKKLLLFLLFTATTASANMLDILQYGIKNNPDRYVSFDLLGTWSEAQELVTYPNYPDQQTGLVINRGVRTQLRFPLTNDMTFLMGGTWATGQYDYTPSTVLQPYTGVTQNFGVEAGFRFYIHN